MRYIPVIFGVVLIIYGLIDCLRSEPSEVRSIPKPVWVLVIVLLPLIGVILWFFFGRPHYAPAASSRSGSVGRPGPHRAPAPVAPDDDPEFLRNLGVSREQKLEAERLRKLQAGIEAREAKLREQELHEKKSHDDKLHEDHPNDEPKH